MRVPWAYILQNIPSKVTVPLFEDICGFANSDIAYALIILCKELNNILGAGPGLVAPHGTPLTGVSNLLAPGFNGYPVVAPCTAQLQDGQTDGETKTFLLIDGSVGDFTLTTVGGSGNTNLFAGDNGGVVAQTVVKTGVCSSITVTWIAQGNGGLGGWYG